MKAINSFNWIRLSDRSKSWFDPIGVIVWISSRETNRVMFESKRKEGYTRVIPNECNSHVVDDDRCSSPLYSFLTMIDDDIFISLTIMTSSLLYYWLTYNVFVDGITQLWRPHLLFSCEWQCLYWQLLQIIEHKSKFYIVENKIFLYYLIYHNNHKIFSFIWRIFNLNFVWIVH